MWRTVNLCQTKEVSHSILSIDINTYLMWILLIAYMYM